jgi:hypothetical protein
MKAPVPRAAIAVLRAGFRAVGLQPGDYQASSAPSFVPTADSG